MPHVIKKAYPGCSPCQAPQTHSASYSSSIARYSRPYASEMTSAVGSKVKTFHCSIRHLQATASFLHLVTPDVSDAAVKDLDPWNRQLRSSLTPDTKQKPSTENNPCQALLTNWIKYTAAGCRRTMPTDICAEHGVSSLSKNCFHMEYGQPAHRYYDLLVLWHAVNTQWQW